MEQMKGTEHENGIIETYTQTTETLVLTGGLLKRTMQQVLCLCWLSSQSLGTVMTEMAQNISF